MATKATITADFATPQDVAARLRIPASRTAELRRFLFSIQGGDAESGVIGQVQYRKARSGKSTRAKKK